MLQLSLFAEAEETTPSPPPPSPSTFEVKLSEQQSRVRDFGAGNQVVVAGAGTGKTEVLTQRILKLLLEGAGNSGAVDLTGVLALTFTDKAAAEMRGRVYHGLVARLRATTDATERARLTELRENFAIDNRISTFDALNRRLLSQFAEYASLSPASTPPSDADRSQMRRDLARQFWAHAGLFSEEEKDELWLFLDLFSSRSRALDAIASAAQNRSVAELEALAESPTEAQWRAQVRRLAAEFTERLWEAHVAQIEDLAANWPDFAPRHIEALVNPDTVRLGRKGILTKTGWSAPWERDVAPRVMAELDRKVKKRLLLWREWSLLAEEGALESDEVAWEREYRSRLGGAALARYALWWRDAATQWLEDRDLADFDDVARAVLEIVGIPSVAMRLRQEISFVLIDEFQDTNAQQWALIDAIRRPTPGNVLIVGDQKQAIYGFRGGDITVFDRVSAQLLPPHEEQQQLTESRRSTEPLVSWTNAAFSDIFPLPAAPREAFESPFQALDALTEAHCGVWNMDAETWVGAAPETVSADLAVQRAAKSVARLLEALLVDAEKWKPLLESAEKPDGLLFPDLNEISREMAANRPAVALLFATHRVKERFEIELRERNIPFVSLKGRGFYECEAVRISLHLWRVLLDGDDRAAWVGLARSPLGGLSDLALLEAYLNGEGESENEFLPSLPQDVDCWRRLQARLLEWRDWARVLPVSQLMERVLVESELAFYESGCPDAAQREENWRKLLDMVRDCEAEGAGGLRALIDFFEAMRENGSNEALAPLPADGSIQLLTAHGAKGLGFPMTILPQMGATPQRDESNLLWGTLEQGEKAERGSQTLAAFGMAREREEEGLNASAPLVWQLLAARANAEREAEWKRLFYVACTRAKSQLVFVLPEGRITRGCWFDLARQALMSPAGAQIRSLKPVSGVATVAPTIEAVPLPGAEPLPYQAPVALETPFDALFGTRNEALKIAAARSQVERRLQAAGTQSKNLGQDVPFCVRGTVLGVPHEWVVGALEWLAQTESGQYLVAGSGSAQRVAALGQAARAMGLEVKEIWELGP